MTYEEVIDSINNAHRFGNLPGVEVSRIVLDKLGNPQKAYPFVHIAGTNGKGSTCAFLDRIFREYGCRTGLFTSPHLIDFEERICVNGQMISKEDVARLGSLLLENDFGVTLTYFDYCLLIAVLYFKEQKIDIAVIETGLGGALDSTNALGIPDAAVIAKIGFDHMAILGNTLGQIAKEKAGIIKDGTWALMESQEPEALEVLLGEAKKHSLEGLHVVTESEISAAAALHLQIRGVHQWENAALAACTAEIVMLKHPQWNVPEAQNGHKADEQNKVQADEQNEMRAEVPAEDQADTAGGFTGHLSFEQEQVIVRGLQNAGWPGRMELLSEDPFFMVDGAHNGNGVSALKKSLETLYPGEKFHFIMGVLADKDYESMVEQLVPLALDFGTITPESSRALQAEKLTGFIRSFGIPACSAGDISDIPGYLKKDAKNIAFGSLYFVGDLKKLFQK